MLDKLQQLWKNYRWNQDDSFGWKTKCLESVVPKDTIAFNEDKKILVLRGASEVYLFVLGKTNDDKYAMVSIKSEKYQDGMGSNNVSSTLFPPFSGFPNLDQHMPIANEALREAYFHSASWSNTFTEFDFKSFIQRTSTPESNISDPIPALVHLAQALTELKHDAVKDVTQVKSLYADPNTPEYSQWRQCIEGIAASWRNDMQELSKYNLIPFPELETP